MSEAKVDFGIIQRKEAEQRISRHISSKYCRCFIPTEFKLDL
jgi:hypothetical protein